MVLVKPLADAQVSYQGSSGRAATDYSKRIQQVTNWQTQATSEQAKTNYSTNVQAAIAAGRREKALSKVTNDSWKSRAINKGAPALSAGIASSGAKWAEGFNPYEQVLSTLTLPPKTTDPVTNLTQRAGAVITAMAAKKKELKG